MPDTEGWKGISVEKLAGGRQHDLVVLTIDAGTICPLHYHRATEEIFHVTDGQAVVEIGTTRMQLSTSESGVVVPVGVWHQIGATDRGPARIIVSCSPPHSDDDIFYE
jgi:mannose-6-phosphate isomerase-like protein (cupin superfamily)